MPRSPTLLRAFQSTTRGWTRATYYLGSTALGGAMVEEVNSSGAKNIGYVYLPGGAQLATQSYGTVIISNSELLAVQETMTALR